MLTGRHDEQMSRDAHPISLSLEWGFKVLDSTWGVVKCIVAFLVPLRFRQAQSDMGEEGPSLLRGCLGY